MNVKRNLNRGKCNPKNVLVFNINEQISEKNRTFKKIMSTKSGEENSFITGLHPFPIRYHVDRHKMSMFSKKTRIMQL